MKKLFENFEMILDKKEIYLLLIALCNRLLTFLLVIISDMLFEDYGKIKKK